MHRITERQRASFWKSAPSDVPSGLVVFLVALPLCLGIALASDAPLFAGIITGIVAGVVVSLLSGAELSVSGPAAGLTVIVAHAIAAVGGFKAFLAAVMFAGVLQLLFGLARVGGLVSFFPYSVIKGMLSAIGIIIVLKQIPHAFGYDADYEGDESFRQPDQENTFTELFNALGAVHWGAVLVTAACLSILILWESRAVKSRKWLSLVPGPLLAVLAAVLMNEAFRLFAPGLYLGVTTSGHNHLVSLPVPDGVVGFFSQFEMPDWGAFSNPEVYKQGAIIAVIASIETLLCIEATDKLDPLKRISSPNRELLAQGTGNFLAGLLGGLPMTSVIVRSSANVYAGARTRLSSFVHGCLLFLSALLIPSLINKIPLAALAAVLLVVGSKLASPKLFKKMAAGGWDQFLPFLGTIVAIVFTDLLTGVLIGLGIGLGFVIKSTYYSAITVVKDGNDYLVCFMKDVSFVNKIKLKKVLSEIPDGSRVLIDGTKAMFIDHDIIEVVEDFREMASHRGIVVDTKNMDSKQFPLFKGEKGAIDGIVQKAVARQ